MVDYTSKYLKYKAKYLALRGIIGGSNKAQLYHEIHELILTYNAESAKLDEKIDKLIKDNWPNYEETERKEMFKLNTNIKDLYNKIEQQLTKENIGKILEKIKENIGEILEKIKEMNNIIKSNEISASADAVNRGEKDFIRKIKISPAANVRKEISADANGRIEISANANGRIEISADDF